MIYERAVSGTKILNPELPTFKSEARVLGRYVRIVEAEGTLFGASDIDGLIRHKRYHHGGGSAHHHCRELWTCIGARLAEHTNTRAIGRLGISEE
jgi:hypothetical protein